MNNSLYATGCGILSLALWSTSGILIVNLTRLPIFEVMSIAFLFCFLLSCLCLSISGDWRCTRQPLIVWVIGIIGICANDLLFIAAFKYAPPAHVELINYLWPILVVLFSAFMPRERLLWQHSLAVILGFASVYVLITNGQGLSGIQSKFLTGYGLAFVEAVCWSIYSLSLRYFPKSHIAMMGLYCGIGCLFTTPYHFLFEKTVIPNAQELLLLFYMGLGTQGVAYYCWTHGMRYGNFKFLCALSYAVPIASIFLLVSFGYAKLTTSLWISCILITLATSLAASKPKSNSALDLAEHGAIDSGMAT